MVRGRRKSRHSEGLHEIGGDDLGLWVCDKRKDNVLWSRDNRFDVTIDGSSSRSIFTSTLQFKTKDYLNLRSTLFRARPSSGDSSSSFESNHLVLIFRDMFSAVSQSFAATQRRTCSSKKSVFSERDLYQHTTLVIEVIHRSICLDLQFTQRRGSL
jgi:hypothetical protein